MNIDKHTADIETLLKEIQEHKKAITELSLGIDKANQILTWMPGGGWGPFEDDIRENLKELSKKYPC